MIVHQNKPKMLSEGGIIARNGILDLIKFWWVPQMSEMIVPKSSHDRFCSKKSSPNAPSTITNSEFDLSVFVSELWAQKLLSPA